MADGSSARREMTRTELVAANINPESLLATDYLNHFNEILMLLDMAVDMPELVEEAASWKPASYVEHFRSSGFAARDLVIEAWDMTRPQVRVCFEKSVEELDALILSILQTLSQADLVDGRFDDSTRELAANGQLQMQGCLSVLMGIIHNGHDNADQSVDTAELTGDKSSDTASSNEAQSQDEIDQLFN